MVILVVTILVGCSKDETELIEDPTIALETGDTLEAILAMGYTKDQIQDLGDYYLVSDDIIFYKDKDYSPSEGETDKQRRHQNLVTINNINIYLNPGMSLDWRNASLDAIARWNNVNSSLNLTVTTVLSNAHIHIMYDTHDPQVNLGYSVYGAGTAPTSDGLPGTKIWINHDFSICNNSSTRISNVQHELGHNLGIAHTNETYNSIQIPGTPTSDSQSVMNGSSACSITNFSFYDIKAIQYLYPPAPSMSVSISGPSKGNNSGTYTWSANVYNGTGPYTYDWRYSYDGSSYNSSFGTTQSITANLPLDRDLHLKVTVTSSSGTATAYRFTMNTDAM